MCATCQVSHFNPLFPYGKRRVALSVCPGWVSFQSTLPIREETKRPRHDHARVWHFNPLFPYGKRPDGSGSSSVEPHFNPLFPYGKRLLLFSMMGWGGRFQSTLPIREETAVVPLRLGHQRISIHSSHTGRNLTETRPRSRSANFNPLFPYGKRPAVKMDIVASRIFQSTLPIREETDAFETQEATPMISIHSSHTGRDRHGYRACMGLVISIHSSHTGRDLQRWSGRGRKNDFNPLFPYGKRPNRTCMQGFLPNFNPLFPYGKRRSSAGAGPPCSDFNPLFPYGKRPVGALRARPQGAISIHSSHTGRDRPGWLSLAGAYYFNPLFPYGKRRSADAFLAFSLAISIHSSHTGRDPRSKFRRLKR